MSTTSELVSYQLEQNSLVKPNIPLLKKVTGEITTEAPKVAFIKPFIKKYMPMLMTQEPLINILCMLDFSPTKGNKSPPTMDISFCSERSK
ncbi:hypothetical protein CJF42_23065 [Pseudoalteromonas sp. NBT06-2]|nr:hypothetical protein CJF42_23065 [Pseudoalteromonas sp. NBT06-2]